MTPFSDFLRQQQKLLLSLAALYLTLIMLPQLPLASPHIWLIAAVFSVFLNLSYMSESYGRRAFLGPQTLISTVLIGAAIFGVVVSPGFLVFGIFGQGVWHLSRRLHAGRPFFRLNTLGCFAVDLIYGAVLLALWLR